MSKPEILLVEDEQVTSMDLKEMIEAIGYSVSVTCDTAEGTLEFLDGNRVDLVLLDIHLAGERDGIDVAGEIQKRFDVPFVYLTAHSNDKTLNRARETQPDGFLVKPITQADLNATLRMVFGAEETE